MSYLLWHIYGRNFLLRQLHILGVYFQFRNLKQWLYQDPVVLSWFITKFCRNWTREHSIGFFWFFLFCFVFPLSFLTIGANQVASLLLLPCHPVIYYLWCVSVWGRSGFHAVSSKQKQVVVCCSIFDSADLWLLIMLSLWGIVRLLGVCRECGHQPNTGTWAQTEGWGKGLNKICILTMPTAFSSIHIFFFKLKVNWRSLT